ncbi:putative nucleotidyltransferase [compost metagenome]
MTDVHQQIIEELGRIEREENVRILYACESGSPAWGWRITRLLSKSAASLRTLFHLNHVCITICIWREGTIGIICRAIRSKSKNTSTYFGQFSLASGLNNMARCHRSSSKCLLTA